MSVEIKNVSTVLPLHKHIHTLHTDEHALYNSPVEIDQNHSWPHKYNKYVGTIITGYCNPMYFNTRAHFCEFSTKFHAVGSVDEQTQTFASLKITDAVLDAYNITTQAEYDDFLVTYVRHEYLSVVNYIYRLYNYDNPNNMKLRDICSALAIRNNASDYERAQVQYNPAFNNIIVSQILLGLQILDTRPIIQLVHVPSCILYGTVDMVSPTYLYRTNSKCACKLINTDQFNIHESVCPFELIEQIGVNYGMYFSQIVFENITKFVGLPRFSELTCERVYISGCNMVNEIDFNNVGNFHIMRVENCAALRCVSNVSSCKFISTQNMDSDSFSIINISGCGLESVPDALYMLDNDYIDMSSLAPFADSGLDELSIDHIKLSALNNDIIRKRYPKVSFANNCIKYISRENIRWLERYLINTVHYNCDDIGQDTKTGLILKINEQILTILRGNPIIPECLTFKTRIRREALYAKLACFNYDAIIAGIIEKYEKCGIIRQVSEVTCDDVEYNHDDEYVYFTDYNN